MPPPDANTHRLTTEWLREADEDLRVGEILLRDSPNLTNPVVFHAQQAVEKLLKAILTWNKVPFPKTHDIERLLVLVESVDQELAQTLAGTTVLTLYEVDMRYPGDVPEVTEAEARDAATLVLGGKDAILAVLHTD